MTVSKEVIETILDRILLTPVKLYALMVSQRPNHTLIEIELDQLDHPYGSVSLLECEQVSRKLNEELEKISPDLNYTLKVSSAGAERKLVIPEDLDRFRGIPVRLVYKVEGSGNKEGIFKILDRKGGKIILEPFSKRKSAASKKKEVNLELKDILKGNLYVSI
ncbi:ribosome maturation factor RimP [Leptospira semungkisensis]|uniref:Ribosome maturation factor RimP n=1 Tax=Leptospira semungkisensis TaxID=2484985 RepID=A0A4R9FQT3_9LEPT|nr:ribosome maturation factor RimP [Leptospira semungkisensis]TGK00924.1 ribosome maturation factor RimP [Leptospira semungkisensis]